MRIAVLAANGRSGKIFVEAALGAGHKINAGVYGTSPFLKNDNLAVFECDATNYEQVLRLFKDCNAVVSLIGHTKKSSATVQTDAIATALRAMHTLGIKRLVSLTGTGVRFEGDKITIIDHILNLSIGFIDPKRIADGKKHVELIKKSDTNWTILRVLKLQNTAPSPFILRSNGPTKPYVSRFDVAAAIIEILEKNSFIQQAPIISNT
ncbi:hypothetical protein EB118_05930 [bacterium]|nr:hypothetical protein [bacterium]NBX97689.1 hypothetical protein [bacterium]NDC94511.1 hypothetical protein [bacterium]NDD83159.1 hypothetical protein [bacterium]NDG29618.1 hypothetical protein [bacterium]